MELSVMVGASAVATPVLAFTGALVGHRVSRRSALELDRWRKREETMRMLRWATEFAVDSDVDRARAGVLVLVGLIDSPLLDEDDNALVSSVLGHVAERLTRESST